MEICLLLIILTSTTLVSSYSLDARSNFPGSSHRILRRHVDGSNTRLLRRAGPAKRSGPGHRSDNSSVRRVRQRTEPPAQRTGDAGSSRPGDSPGARIQAAASSPNAAPRRQMQRGDRTAEAGLQRQAGSPTQSRGTVSLASNAQRRQIPRIPVHGGEQLQRSPSPVSSAHSGSFSSASSNGNTSPSADSYHSSETTGSQDNHPVDHVILTQGPATVSRSWGRTQSHQPSDVYVSSGQAQAFGTSHSKSATAVVQHLGPEAVTVAHARGKIIDMKGYGTRPDQQIIDGRYVPSQRLRSDSTANPVRMKGVFTGEGIYTVHSSNRAQGHSDSESP